MLLGSFKNAGVTCLKLFYYKKALLDSDVTFETVLIDATESPVERPKKDSATTTQAKRNATP